MGPHASFVKVQLRPLDPIMELLISSLESRGLYEAAVGLSVLLMSLK